MGIVISDVVVKIQGLHSKIGYSLTDDAAVLTEHLRACIQLSETIKAEVRREGFNNTADEIRFFKQVKPQLISLYYYYRRTLDILRRIPAASIAVKERILIDERRKLDHYALNHQELQMYLQRGLENSDEMYYTRKWNDTEIFDDYRLVDLDRSYSTRMGFATARLLAHPYLYRYIDRQVKVVTNTHTPLPNQRVQWVGKKVNLVTLIYGLVETKQVDCDVSQLAQVLSEALSLELNNIYGMWQDIKMRKKEKLPFIKELNEVLSNKIADEQ